MNPTNRSPDTEPHHAAPAHCSSGSSIDDLVESFITRQRRGERPTIEEYIARHPELAQEIREVFPALAIIEGVGATGAACGARSSHVALPIPNVLGDFRIVREIGRGGMGVVYEAVQETLGRHVALKVLPPSLYTTTVHLERFRREAKSAACLHHTNIVPVFAVGEQDGIVFYAMQYIRGQTLEAVLAELRKLRDGGPALQVGAAADTLSAAARSLFVERAELSANATATGDTRSVAPPEADRALLDTSPVTILSSGGRRARYFRNVAELGVQAAEALAYAHSHGLVHRDIKPSNLMLEANGTLWVTDFGLVKMQDDFELTSPGDILGTLCYMPPEQLSGRTDARSDVYSLGITLYELATLRRAFLATDRGRLVDDIRRHDPPPLRQIDGGVPRDLETIILKAIAKDPPRRYATAQKLADDLRRFLADKPVQARRAGWLEHGWRWCRRNQGVAALLGLIGLLLTGVAVASMVAAVFFREQQIQTRNARDDAQQRLWKSLLSQAEARSASPRPGRRFESLAMLQEALTLADRRRLTDAELLRFRNAVVACLALPDIETVRTWETLIGSAHGWNCGYDVDARLFSYVRADENGAVSVRRVEDDGVVADFPARGRPVHVHLSPDGSRLAIHDAGGNHRRLEIWDLQMTPARRVHEFVGNLGAYVAFTPDGSRAAYYVLGQEIRAVDLNRRTMRKFVTSQNDYWRPLAFSPDGRYLTRVVIVERDWRVQLLDVADMTVTTNLAYRRTLVTRARPDSVAFSADGRTLAAGCDDQRITLFDVATGRILHVLEGHATIGISVAFDPTGRRLYSTDWSNLLRVWDTTTGRQLCQLPSRGRIIRPSSDGRLVTQNESQDGRLRILRTAMVDEVRPVTDPVTRAGGEIVSNSSCFSATDQLFAVEVRTRLGEPFGGFLLIDPVSGEMRAWNEKFDARPIGFLADGTLITQGRGGMRRWPRTIQGDVVRFGPPEDSAIAGVGDPPAVDESGKIWLIRVGESIFLLRRPGLADAILRVPLDDARCAAISPDGRWIVAGNHGVNSDGNNALVYDVMTLRIVARLQVEGQCRVGFSSDSKWLWTTSGHCRIWDVDGWKLGFTVPGVAVAVSPHTNVVAVGGDHGSVRLLHLRTGAELATLSYPDSQRLLPHAFTTDGTRLLVYAEDSRVGLIWNLRLIRQELAARELDWDAPPYPAELAPGTPQRVEVRLTPSREVPETNP